MPETKHYLEPEVVRRALKRLEAKRTKEIEELKHQITVTDMWYRLLQDRVRNKCPHVSQEFLGYFCSTCGEFLG
jgi:hypothetical protein